MYKAALVATTLTVALIGPSAFAQTPAQSGPQNPAVKTDAGNNANMPVRGANSYTMAEARSHIMRKGYTRVSGLKKDNSGVWRGTAMKEGQLLHVSVDYQGNVNAN
jgi:hypothetical protein